MIPFNFEYYKPSTLEDAVNLFMLLDSQEKKPIYYGGGTEFISMARMHNVYSKAIIDIKGIEECNIHEIKNDELIIGSAVTLTLIGEQNLFPLLSSTAKRIADHTIQNKITLGGNMVGTIIYKETLVPLMIAEGEIVIIDINGTRRLSVMELLNNGGKFSKGELIVQVVLKKDFLNLPSLHVKRTKNEKIDYPLITIGAINHEDKIKIGFSGLCEYPFRSLLVEKYLNDKSISRKSRIDKVIKEIDEMIITDLSGSKEYRKFMLYTMLDEVLENFEGLS